ncbi:hypothetical protein GCM10017688_19710 [Streptomyces ramulosus]
MPQYAPGSPGSPARRRPPQGPAVTAAHRVPGAARLPGGARLAKEAGRG